MVASTSASNCTMPVVPVLVLIMVPVPVPVPIGTSTSTSAVDCLIESLLMWLTHVSKSLTHSGYLLWLISPMHRTDVCIDASNFQPMNGIKQHLGESIIRCDICFNMSGVSFCWQFSWLNLIFNNVILSLSVDQPMNLTTVWCIGEINRWIKQRSLCFSRCWEDWR